MDKKELQKQRMMKYFIDAAKTLMKQEDLKDISVRKIADLAGGNGQINGYPKVYQRY